MGGEIVGEIVGVPCSGRTLEVRSRVLILILAILVSITVLLHVRLCKCEACVDERFGI